MPSVWAIEIAGRSLRSGRRQVVEPGPAAQSRRRSQGRPGTEAALPLPARAGGQPPWPRSDPRVGVYVQPPDRPAPGRRPVPRGRAGSAPARPSRSARAISSGGASQTATASRGPRPGKRQLLADEDRLRRPEDVAIACWPVKPPVFPVSDLDPDAAVGTHQLGIHPHAMPLNLADPDPARDRRAHRGGRSVRSSAVPFAAGR